MQNATEMNPWRFVLPPRRPVRPSEAVFAQRRTLSLQLTGLRPKPEQRPKQQHPKQQRLHPKRPWRPKQQRRSQQQQRPKQQQPNPKLQQQVPKQPLRR